MFLLENGDKKNDFISFHFISFYLTFYFLRCILHCKKYKLKTYYLTLQSSVHQATLSQEIMTPVTRNSIHIGSHTSRYDYLNAARKNLGNDDDKQQQQQSYDQECFDGGDDARISISTRTTRNSKLKQQQQQEQEQQQKIVSKKTKSVAFAATNQNQKQKQEPAQEQQPEQNHKGKMLSKRQAKKYDAHIEAANILASIALAAASASASKKERTPTYWTRQHEKAKASGQRQKAMMSVLECDDE